MTRKNPFMNKRFVKGWKSSWRKSPKRTQEKMIDNLLKSFEN
jgi:hypothetical protein|tara:strand:- start:165 stop:290 length:126 start_codon:yes stop_codon:yes gene_type:complete